MEEGPVECPVCRNPIVDPGEKCHACGLVFEDHIHGRLSLYFSLRDEVEQVRALTKNELWVRLKAITEKMGLYEDQLQEELRAYASRTSAAPEVAAEQGPEIAQDDEVVSSALHPGQRQERPVSAPSAVRRPATGTEDDRTSGMEVRLGQKWLLIIGLVTMVFGVGYFLKYSFEQGWIGPAGRVAMAYAWGISFLLAGNRFRKSYETYGLYMIGGGIAILYFSTFAAFQLYHLLGQTPAFAVMVLVTALACALAVVYDSLWLSVLGLVGGFLTPVLLSTGQDNQVALMTYMTILDLGILGIAFYKKWDLLTIFGFIFTYMLYGAWYMAHYGPQKFWPAIIFLNVFYLIYSIAPFAYQLLRKAEGRLEGFILITPNSFIAFGLSYAMVKAQYSLQWVSVVSISYAVIFLLMASYLVKRGMQDQAAFAALVGKAALFLIITVPLIFSRHWITVFWAAQALVLLWMGIHIGRRTLSGGAYLLLALAVAKFLFYDYEEVFRFSLHTGAIREAYTYLLAERYATSVFVCLALYGFGMLLRRSVLDFLSSSFRLREEASVIHVALGVVVFIVLNVETSSFFHDYLPAARFAAASVLWAVFSVVLMVKGFRDNSPAVRKVALVLFSVTLLKVFTFDMSNISTPYRIISFIILGLMLVGTSYLYYRFKDRILDAMAEAQDERGKGA